MKIIHLNESDGGGAGRAAYRLMKAQRTAGLDARLWVIKASSGDSDVSGFACTGKLGALKDRIRRSLSSRLTAQLKTANRVIHTPAIWSTEWIDRINASDADVVNLHWISDRMLSVRDIGRIRKPTVWTLHDMWAFCGAEHYTDDHRWRDGYRADNRPDQEGGFDLNRWTWRRKRRHWKTPINIVTPSAWLADSARQSILMRDWPVRAVANCLDLEQWQPIDKAQARHLLGLPSDAPLVLFGALGGGGSARKGFDLLLEALGHLRGQLEGLNLVVFGQRPPSKVPDLGFPIHYTGHLNDELSLRAVYSAADIFVIPSRQDNLPNTGVEAHACGTPVVAFRTGGLADIVTHQQTGYLAKPFETRDLADGIKWVINQAQSEVLSHQARQRALACFSGPVVVRQYLNVYNQAVAANEQSGND